MSRRIHVLTLAAAALLLAPLSSGSAAAAASCTGNTVPLRLAASSASGVVGLTAAAAGTGQVTVARLRSGSDYLYVRDAASRRAAESAGYRDDGETIRGSATPAPGCTVTLYQLQRGKAHRLAVGGAGAASLAVAGWKVQGPLLYAADPPGRARAVANGPVAGALPAHDEDPVFRIAVLPDTQEEVHTDTDARLRQRAQYIADHRDSWDLRLAVSVGDIGDWDTPDHAQYARAAQQLQPLVRSMPFVAAVGNHDTAAPCPGGSACAGLRAGTTVRDTTVFNTYFPARRFSLLRSEYEPGKIDNAYHTFRAGGADWLVLNLELWPRPQVVDWAARVVAANPRRNVIVVTHSYLTRGGNIKGDNGGYGSTSPKYLYDHLIKAYPNVKVVLSGHTGKDKMRIDKGVGGNRVVSYLQCFHSRTGNPFRRLSFDLDRGTISSAIFTPSTGTRVNDAKATRLAFIR
ncbi:MAG: metallophosphoesterase [Janthinobacterium lividum]